VGCLYRGITNRRPSVVGNITSSICIGASVSSTTRGVSPGAKVKFERSR